jgi:iron complex outermembrane recepter protein
MKIFTKLATSAAPAVIGLALLSTPAFAQDEAAAEGEEASNDAPIVVTGSLIKNPNLEQANPVNVTTADAIELKQSNTAEEVLREIPGVVSNIGSAVNNGNGGSSYVDLRGLGSNRNIVLLDGNRIAPADLQGRVDLNNIPLALVSRVDSLTGAAVTTYGADAITGVVNFITKKDFAGVDLSISDQITQQGDGNFLRADLTVGANFEDGRGNAVLSIGYQESDPVYQGDRDFSVFGIDSYTGTLGGSGTSVPTRIAGTRPLTGGAPNTTPESIFTGRGAPTTAQPLGVPIYVANPGGAANGGVRQINAAGQAVPTFAFFNFNPYNIFQTPYQRYNLFAQANYEISDAIEVYTRGMFSKNNVKTIIAPSGSFGAPVSVNLNNPFVSSTLAAQWCAFDVNPRPDIYTPRFSAAECSAARAATGTTDPNYRVVGGTSTLVAFDVNNDGTIAPGEGYQSNPGITLARRAIENGPRISDYSTTVFDYRFGARGALSESLDWDLSASYGESEKVQTIQNYLLTSRVRQSLLANNTTSCQVTTGGCLPVNWFGQGGEITSAQADFLSDDSTSTVKTSLAQVRGVLSGDLGVTSPGASEPIGFAGGVEYRKYKAQQASDVLAKTPGELGGAGGAAPDINGGYDVYEAYAEIIAPLIEDKPLFHSLTLEAGARYSKYTVSDGNKNDTFTYKVGATWEPVEDIKLRGNYSRAVRAPNVAELFTPFTVGLTTLRVDPCAGAAPTTNANLQAVCLAQGATSGSIGNIANPTAAQANIFSGGTTTLDPETATTWTLGAVFQPNFLPGFSLSVDYYNIKVKDVIGTALPGDYIDACFKSLTAASATDPNCTLIRRNPVTGGLDGDPSTTRGLFAPITNNGRLFTDGVDLIANYQRELGNNLEWASSFVFNYTKNSKFQSLPNATTPSLNRQCVSFYSGNCSFTGSLQPKFQWSWRNTVTVDKIDISLLWRHIDGFTQEPDDVVQSGAAFTGVFPVGFGYNEGQTVDFGDIKAADYFDLTLRFNVSDNFTMTAVVQNLLNKQPPVIGSSIGSTAFNSGNTYPSTYDALGRRFGLSARMKF